MKQCEYINTLKLSENMNKQKSSGIQKEKKCDREVNI